MHVPGGNTGPDPRMYICSGLTEKGTKHPNITTGKDKK